MKRFPWITLPALAVLAAATAVGPDAAQAQQGGNSANQPASTSPPTTASPAKSSSGSKAKPPVHKPEQSALNQTEHDERAKKALEDSRALLRESLRKEQAAKQEAQRLTKDQLTPATATGSAFKDPEKAVRDLRNKISPEKADAIKDQVRKTAKTLLDSDDAKKLIEEAKKKASEAGAQESKKSKSSDASTPGAPPLAPTTFDTIPGPTAAAPAALPAASRRPISGLLKGEHIVMPPSMDPKNPKQKIKPEDPVGRTIVLTGNAQIKMPTMQVDADEIVLLKSISGSGSGPFDFGASPSAPSPAKPAGASGKSAGTDKNDDASNGLESMVATGRVRVLRLDKGSEIHAKGNRMVYDQQKGSTTMTGWPSLQQENKVITPEREDAVIVLYSNEKDPYTTHCSVKILSDTKSSAAGNKATPNGDAPAVSSSQGETTVPASGGKPASPATSSPESGAQRQSPPRRPAGPSR